MFNPNPEHICQYNDAIACDCEECYHCGWDPEVAEQRKAKIMGLKRYKIPFTGYCEVWAKSPEEAADKAENIENQFFAHYNYGDPECLEKEENDELD